MSIKLRDILKSGNKYYALTPGGIRAQLGVQLLDALDVTAYAEHHPLYGQSGPTLHGVEINATAEDLAAHGLGGRGYWVTGATTKPGGEEWSAIPLYTRRAPVVQIAIEIRPADAAREQLRQLDDDEARLA